MKSHTISGTLLESLRYSAQRGRQVLVDLLRSTIWLIQMFSRPVMVLGAFSLIFCLFPFWRVVADFEHVRPADVLPQVIERAQWFQTEALVWVLGCAGVWCVLRLFNIVIANWSDSHPEDC